MQVNDTNEFILINFEMKVFSFEVSTERPQMIYTLTLKHYMINVNLIRNVQWKGPTPKARFSNCFSWQGNSF